MTASDELIGQTVSHSRMFEKLDCGPQLQDDNSARRGLREMGEAGMPDQNNRSAPECVPTHLASMSALSLAARRGIWRHWHESAPHTEDSPRRGFSRSFGRFLCSQGDYREPDA